MATISTFESDEKGRPRSAAQVVTSAGTPIYLLPVETFPNHVNNLYLIDHPDQPLLFDVGTPSGHAQLVQRFEEIADRFGVTTRLADVRCALISHAHIDHFGNCHNLRAAGVPIAIHERDARVLASFQERLVLASRDFGVFMHRAGVRPERVVELLALYRAGKRLFDDLIPDRRLRNHERVGAGWEVLHVPGHCPGMVCLRIDDVVLTADHVLSRITPAQSPHSITPYMGLENYLRSLDKLAEWGPFDLALGAHEAPITDLGQRIAETRAHHIGRLRKTYAILEQTPGTIAEVSRALFGRQRGYGVILALGEAGAHVEYLHEMGYLAVDNIASVTADLQAAAVYRTSETPLPAAA